METFSEDVSDEESDDDDQIEVKQKIESDGVTGKLLTIIQVLLILYFNKPCWMFKISIDIDLREGFKKNYGIFHTLVGWVGLKKSFSIKNKNKKHVLKMPK